MKCLLRYRSEDNTRRVYLIENHDDSFTVRIVEEISEGTHTISVEHMRRDKANLHFAEQVIQIQKGE